MIMKRNTYIFYIILIMTFALLLVGCKNDLDSGEPELQEMKTEISRLETESAEQNQQIKEFGIITENLNLLLSAVYYGAAESMDTGREKNFTAFGMFYKEEYYLITAGHCIEYDGIKYTNFKFKPNFSLSWIFPELVDFNNDHVNNKDFAIFKHDSIRRGLIIDEKYKEPAYVLGNINRKINIFKDFNNAIEGESGSPILSSRGKLVGITIKNNDQYTPIKAVTDALDKLINNDSGSG